MFDFPMTINCLFIFLKLLQEAEVPDWKWRQMANCILGNRRFLQKL